MNNTKRSIFYFDSILERKSIELEDTITKDFNYFNFKFLHKKRKNKDIGENSNEVLRKKGKIGRLILQW